MPDQAREETTPAPPGRLRRGLRRATRPLALVAAILAAFLIVTVSVDLGPALRSRAERADVDAVVAQARRVDRATADVEEVIDELPLASCAEIEIVFRPPPG